MPVCILALVAGSSLARIPQQDKPAPGATPATSEKQAAAATPPVTKPAGAPADAKSGATKTVPAAAGTAGKDKAQPSATPPPVVTPPPECVKAPQESAFQGC